MFKADKNTIVILRARNLFVRIFLLTTSRKSRYNVCEVDVDGDCSTWVQIRKMF